MSKKIFNLILVLIAILSSCKDEEQVLLADSDYMLQEIKKIYSSNEIRNLTPEEIHESIINLLAFNNIKINIRKPDLTLKKMQLKNVRIGECSGTTVKYGIIDWGDGSMSFLYFYADGSVGVSTHYADGSHTMECAHM